MYMKMVNSIKSLRSYCEKMAGGTGLTMTEILIMSALHEHEEKLSIGAIAVLTGIAKPNMTPNIDKLENAGYVKRVHNNEDRRQIHILLCDKGVEMIEAIEERLASSKGIATADKALDTILKFAENAH